MDMDNITSAELQTFIQEEYQNFVYLWLLFSSVALLFYSTVLSFAKEIKCIWNRRFTIPSVLYLLARYPILLSQIILLSIQFLPETAPESTCNVLINVANALSVPAFIGIQGLLSARAYSLYRGNRILALVLGTLFIVGFVCNIFVPAAIPGCASILTKGAEITNLMEGIAVVITDTVVFLVTVYKLWGTWKLKRQVGLEATGGGNFVELLLAQGVLRYGFVFFVTVTNIAIEFPVPAFSHLFDLFQNAVSVILLCDFSLDLRARNSQTMTSQHDIASLPSIKFTAQGARNVLRRAHDTLISELGELSQHNDLDENQSRDGEDVEAIELEIGTSKGKERDSDNALVSTLEV